MAVAATARFNLCTTCRKPLFSDEWIFTKCWHVFCKTCFENWTQKSTVCVYRCGHISKEEQHSEQCLQICYLFAKTNPKALYEKANLVIREDEKEDPVCISCLESPFPQVYFSEKFGFIHKDCVQKTQEKKISLYANQIAKLARQLIDNSNRDLPKAFLVTVINASFCAWAVNFLIYENTNKYLWAISIPILMTKKIISLTLSAAQKTLA